MTLGQALLLSKGHSSTLPQPFLTLPQPFLNPSSTLPQPFLNPYSFLDFNHSAALLWWILEIFILYTWELSWMKSSS